MRIDIDVKGLERVKAKLGSRAASDLQDAIETDLGVEARKMATDGAKNAPVETGALRASILSSPRRAGTMTYYWGSRLPYALRQEYEHKSKRGWMRTAWRVGKRRAGKTFALTIKRKLG